MKTKQSILRFTFVLLFICFAVQLSFAEYWSPLNVRGTKPQSVWNHTAVFDTTANRNWMGLFGGYVGGGFTTHSNDVWVGYQTDTGYEWSKSSTSGAVPPPREDHTAILYEPTPGNPAILIYGGKDMGSIYDDMYRLDINTRAWSQVTAFGGGKPPKLTGHSAVWNQIQNMMVVFGGYDSTYNVTHDVYIYRPQIPSWTKVTTVGTPTTCPARAEHSAVLVGNQMYVFGGTTTDTNDYANDIWRLNLSTVPYIWSKLTPSGFPPAPRANHTAVYDSDLNRMLVFGGRGQGAVGPDYYNDVFALDMPEGTTWTMLSTGTMNPPAVREGQSAVYDTFYRRMLMFSGGEGYPPLLNDLWELFVAIAPATADIGSGGGIISAGTAGRYQPRIIIPPDSLPGMVNFTVSESVDNHGLPTAVTFGPSGTMFSAFSPATVGLQFVPWDVPPDGSTPATMRIFVYDTSLGTWVKVPYRQNVDTTTNTVYVPIYHLSDYVVMSGHP
ncbi:MAG: kelch repeat-containing protein, partial [bacterium]|nr:kelch repeat-containing protein [bacterium]